MGCDCLNHDFHDLRIRTIVAPRIVPTPNTASVSFEDRQLNAGYSDLRDENRANPLILKIVVQTKGRLNASYGDSGDNNRVNPLIAKIVVQDDCMTRLTSRLRAPKLRSRPVASPYASR